MTRNMTRKEFEQHQESFKKSQEFWGSLKKGDTVYSSNGWDVFKHTIVEVNVDECKALVIDHSQGDKQLWTDHHSISYITKEMPVTM